MHNNSIQISELINEFESLGKIIWHIGHFHLEACLQHFNYIDSYGNELLLKDILICSESVFLDSYEEVVLNDSLLVDLQDTKSSPLHNSLYENQRVLVSDLFITVDSLEMYRKNPNGYNHSIIRTMNLSFPILSRNDAAIKFMNLKVDNKILHLTKDQAKIIWFLWNHKKIGIHEVDSNKILNYLGQDILKIKVRDIFRASDGKVVYRKILSQKKRGLWSLNMNFETL